MTLTEEQRAAVEYAIKYIPNWPSTPKGCRARDVLRAMIDSSGTVEPTGGFDLEKARAVDIDLLATTDWGELRARYRAALAEIERLRPFEIAARDLDSDLTKIAGERDDQAARIQELEDALAEERAKYNLSWKDCAYRAPDTYCEKTHNYCTSEDCPLLDEQKTEARRQLQAEGKIGREDATPKIKRCYSCGRSLDEIDCDNFTCCDCAPSWQITDERKAAIERLIIPVEILLVDHETDPEIEDAVRLLRGMLEGAGQ